MRSSISRKQADAMIARTKARGGRVTGADDLPRDHKFKAAPVDHDGEHYDSTLEFGRLQDLKRLQRAGLISDLRHHVTYRIDVNGVHICNYEADAVYIEDGCIIVEDAKGVETAKFKLQKKLMLAVHGVHIRLYKHPTPKRKGNHYAKKRNRRKR